MAAIQTIAPVPVPKAVQAAFELLSQAAERGAKCPSNAEIADAMGRATPASATNAVALLETLGLIEVTRYSMARHVRIVSTGAETQQIRAPALVYLADRKRREVWRTREVEETFADELAEHGDIGRAARAAGVAYRQGRTMFDSMRRDLGRQAA